jgi:hypothetical protein
MTDTTAPHASPDPGNAPSAYRDALLGALGTADPAEVQAATPGRLWALVADAGADLRTRPEPGEWSVLECIAHVADGELVVSGRYRWILAETGPDIAPYDQDLWVRNLRHNEADPADLIDPFEALRAANLRLWRQTPVEARSRTGLHLERGPESYDETFRMMAGHDLVHLDQARQTVAAVRRGRQGS